MKRLWKIFYAFLLVVGMVVSVQAEHLSFGKNLGNSFNLPDSFRLAQNQTSFTKETSGDKAQEESTQGGYTDEEIAEMINNPLGNLWMLKRKQPARRLAASTSR